MWYRLVEALVCISLALVHTQVCFSKIDQPPVYMVYNRTRWESVDAMQKGNVCLGSHLTKQGVVQQCRDWVEQVILMAKPSIIYCFHA